MPNPTDNQVLVLGETNFRNQKQRFGIRADDRRRHMYVIGSTGMGKSEYLKNMAIQDIEEGRGLAVLDPHGDAAMALLDFVPPHRIKDVIYFDPSDLTFPIAFNVLDKVDYEYRHLVAAGLMGVFKKIWVDAWSGRMEYILNNTILALLETEGATLLAINRMLADKAYRKQVVASVKDPIVKAFWVEEFAKYTDKFASEATASIQNKVGQFSSNNVIRNIVGQEHSKLDIRKIMDEGKILIVNLSKGAIGEDASRLIGALLITKIQLAAMSRVDTPEVDRRDFYLYVDEFQNFATESFAGILSEARKYHLSLVVAHQYITQMQEEVRDAVFGNVGTIVTFRVGAEDAEFLEKWYAPDFTATDIVNLGKRQMYMKLMVNGVTSKGFSCMTIDSFVKPEINNHDELIAWSRETYANPRDAVEKEVAAWAAPAGPAEPEFPQRQQSNYPPRRSNGGGQGMSRPPQQFPRQQAPRQFQPPQPPRPPAPPRQEGISLSALQGGPQGTVDFKGRQIEPRDKTSNPTAQTTSYTVPSKELASDDLKKLIREALEK